MGCWAALSEEEGRGRKDGGMEKGERGQKGGGGRTVKHSWRSVDQTHTLILTHTQTQTHTVHIKRKTEPMWSWRFICWCTTNSFWVVMWNWSDAHLHEPSVSADFVAVFPSYSFNLSLRRLCKTGCYQSKRIKSSKKKIIKITQFRFRGFLLLKVFICLLNCCSSVTGGDDGIICM